MVFVDFEQILEQKIHLNVNCQDNSLLKASLAIILFKIFIKL
jgi:hypothetical protein